MALKAGYKGFKKLAEGLKLIRPGTLAIDDAALGKTFFPRSEQDVLGAKNFFNPSITTKTENGVTWTVNPDKTISTNGTTNADTSTYLGEVYLESGTYILSGNPTDDPNHARLRLSYKSDDTKVIAWDDGDGAKFTVETSQSFYLRVRYAKDINLSDYIFEPMIRLASDPDNTYVPYAMTNRELTDSAADQKTAINAIITAATGAADFAAFKTAMGVITPVTRSLSLTKEDITEEVKEDVEPEKTVTKKRATKKTEEV